MRIFILAFCISFLASLVMSNNVFAAEGSADKKAQKIEKLQIEINELQHEVVLVILLKESHEMGIQNHYHPKAIQSSQRDLNKAEKKMERLTQKIQKKQKKVAGLSA